MMGPGAECSLGSRWHWWLALLSTCLGCDADVTTLPLSEQALSEAHAAGSATPGFGAIAPTCEGPACGRALDAGSGPPACGTVPILMPATPGRRESLSVSGSNESALDTSQSTLGGCRGGTSGPDVWYALDLSHAQGSVDLRVVLDANFDAAVDLRRGPCDDSLSLDCDRASAVGRPSSALHRRLDPGTYWLVVSGRDAESRGQFRLQLELDATSAECLETALDESCDDARRLEPFDLQTVLLDTHCPGPDEPERSFYYELDLRAEPAPVLATLSQWSFAEPHYGHLYLYRGDVGPSCGSLLAESFSGDGAAVPSDSVLNALLPPGRYFVELAVYRLDVDDLPSPVALSVRLDRRACSAGPLGNRCETAIELDTEPGLHTVEGMTTCNDDHVNLEDCGDYAAPDQFYRLDLRAKTGLSRVRLNLPADGIDFWPLLYVLLADEAGSCGEPLYCNDMLGVAEGLPAYELTLTPGLYFIGVDGALSGSSGHYRLQVEVAPASPRPCIDARVDRCVRSDDMTNCCADRQNPGCARVIAACGLMPSTQDCVCRANAACCGAEGDRSGCPEVLLACSYVCPDFAPSEFACVGADR
jgi:hypothetical protein